MRKQVHSIIVVLCATLILTGCSHKNPDPDGLKSECTIQGVEAPRWVCGLHHEANAYTGVGSAKIGALGFGFARQEALANARADLARQASLELKSRIDNYYRSTGADQQEAERVAEQVSHITAEATIADSKQIAYWEHPDTQTIYILVKADKKRVFQNLKKRLSDQSVSQQSARAALKALESDGE